MRVVRIKYFICVFLAIISFGTYAQGQWRVQNERQVTLAYGAPSTGITVFAITYPSNDCRPIASIIAFTGSELGRAISQVSTTRTSEQMIWMIDGVSFSSRTAKTEHSNGFEIAMYAPNGLVEKIPTARNISVTFAGREIISNIPFITEGFVRANNEAISTCRG